ncbi:MAG: P-II family nitrogen regulator [Bacteroidota bacterium]
MKKIEAIIRLTKFDEVRDSLASIGIQFFTMHEVKGFGLQKGPKKMYRGSMYGPDYIARLQLDIFVTDDKSDEVVKTITSAARTGEIGDGKITVTSLDAIIRIRTGEIGESAI